jgi:hypothetical protein
MIPRTGKVPEYVHGVMERENEVPSIGEVVIA